MTVKLEAGQVLPDYVLPDHTKTARALSALQGDDPMLLVLIRGFFCPKDREQLKALTRFHPQLVVGNCRLVVVTTDDWHTTTICASNWGRTIPFCTTSRSGCGMSWTSWSTRTRSMNR